MVFLFRNNSFRMKRLLFYLLVLLSLSSCNQKDGDSWYWVKNEDMTFPKKGGEQTAVLMEFLSKSSASWTLLGGRIASYVDGEWIWPSDTEDPGMFSPVSSDGDNSHNRDLLEADWFRAIVPDLGHSGKLIVTVEENSSGFQRKAFVRMRHADYYPVIYITQE